MKSKTCYAALAAAILAAGTASADLLIYDGFDYDAGDATANDGGSGWAGAWYDTGNSTVVIENGLDYTDSFGNKLVTTGGALRTSDGTGTTTISARETGLRNGELWVSMVIQPQGNLSQFFGASFYLNGLATANARFAVENASNQNLRLARRAGGNAFSGAYTTTLGVPVLAVLRLVPGGGPGDPTPDRIDVHFNPLLHSEPTVASFSLNIDGVQFDRIRVAGASGMDMIVDELRIGETYADVTPYIPADDPDSDGDGLTDAQELLLGTDPNVSDAAFFAALRANPGFFGLHSAEEISDVTIGGLALQAADGEVDYTLRISGSDGAVLDTITRSLPSPPERKFLRIALDVP